jgi:hypothetical protein
MREYFRRKLMIYKSPEVGNKLTKLVVLITWCRHHVTVLAGW